MGEIRKEYKLKTNFSIELKQKFVNLTSSQGMCGDGTEKKILTNTYHHTNKASQAIQSPRTVPFFLLVSLLDGYSFPNVLVKGIVAFKH